jgi:hypothetical protein
MSPRQAALFRGAGSCPRAPPLPPRPSTIAASLLHCRALWMKMPTTVTPHRLQWPSQEPPPRHEQSRRPGRRHGAGEGENA